MTTFEVDPEDLAGLWADAGPWVEAEDAASLLGLTQAALESHRLNGLLLGCEFPGQIWLYPAKQFSDGRVLEGMPRVIAVLRGGGADGYRIADWLLETTSFAEPHRNAWDELQEGNIHQVLRAARQDAQRWKVRQFWEQYPPPPIPD